MSNTTDTILNHERLAALRAVCDGEDDLVVELAELYRDEIPKRVDDLVAAADAGKLPIVRNIAHFVKGASSNVGAEELAGLCLQLETAALDGDVAQAAAVAHRIEIYFPLVLEALASTVGNRQ